MNVYDFSFPIPYDKEKDEIAYFPLFNLMVSKFSRSIWGSSQTTRNHGQLMGLAERKKEFRSYRLNPDIS